MDIQKQKKMMTSILEVCFNNKEANSGGKAKGRVGTEDGESAETKEGIEDLLKFACAQKLFLPFFQEIKRNNWQEYCLDYPEKWFFVQKVLLQKAILNKNAFRELLSCQTPLVYQRGPIVNFVLRNDHPDGTRLMNDLDIAVLPGYRTGIQQELAAHGYRHGYLTSQGDLVPFDDYAGNLVPEGTDCSFYKGFLVQFDSLDFGKNTAGLKDVWDELREDFRKLNIFKKEQSFLYYIEVDVRELPLPAVGNTAENIFEEQYAVQIDQQKYWFKGIGKEQLFRELAIDFQKGFDLNKIKWYLLFDALSLYNGKELFFDLMKRGREKPCNTEVAGSTRFLWEQMQSFLPEASYPGRQD